MVWAAYTKAAILFLSLACIIGWRWDFPIRLLPEGKGKAVAGKSCVECHKQKTPGIYRDWKAGVHGKENVDCRKCHRPNNDGSNLKSHLQYTEIPISVVVSPVNCGGCHPRQAQEFSRSKHANTIEIIWKIDSWLNQGMVNSAERTTGCYACHGTEVVVKDGRPVESTWPNVGVGRINPDGSKGSCSSCHTRHRFSIEEARKPEACGQCHLGPDHPQIEIYHESKHGAIYRTEGYRWAWGASSGAWKAGEHFRAPTCAVCHMSAAGKIRDTHDATERLSWEMQAPRTVRPNEFKPFPSAADWREERKKMEGVCLQCHSSTWTQDHFRNLDAVIENYNERYYDPVKSMMDRLEEEGLVSAKPYFDEEIEWEFYEFWHHEGRRARMGAAMMAPDYAWWHGFYELKRRYLQLERRAGELRKKNIENRQQDLPERHPPGRHP
ncbi:MAG: hydroxylamine oxidoreductase [Desulfobacteraceae bacterium]|nr:MAG: hydroxylamine oxidoreductase [Desulfobacteraceae bacterium]